ncbi:MAG: ISL3 family transposase [Verrucomicrobiaceae bacterium]|nr:ISL3 family transposase [Verrucomicrobiaceae bacterium]
MPHDQSLQQHYHLLLGLDKDWEVQEVKLSLEARTVCIRLRHRGGLAVICPGCQRRCSIFDHAPERKWRHLDTMQFETELRTRVPRCQCEHCGVKTIEVPWAGKHSPFTWMFEAFGVAVLQSAASTREACELLRIGWEGAHRLMERAVKRGLARRSLEDFEHAGMDEKSFGSGHDYITTLNDLSEGSARVIEVVHGRKHEDAVALLEQIPESHRRRIKAVAMDMWDAYLKAARQVLPEADIVHDRYHISAHLNAAVDRVRKDEHKRLMGEGDDTLKGSKYQWLRTHADKRSSEAVSFRKLHELGSENQPSVALQGRLPPLLELPLCRSCGAVLQRLAQSSHEQQAGANQEGSTAHRRALAGDTQLRQAPHHQRSERGTQ